MADQDAKMVLRTVYLPPDLDDQLRVRAFRQKASKNDLIREAVALWLKSEGAAAANGVPKPRSKRRLRTAQPTDADPILKTAIAKD